MNISGWTTFGQIIDDIMLAWGDSSDQGQRMRLLNFAVKQFMDLRLGKLSAAKPVRLTINTEMRCIVVPDDYLRFVSVGLFYDGIFYKFQPKSEMPAITASDCGIEEREIADGTDSAGEEIVEYIGYYTLDIENRRILIEAPALMTEVILNYVPTGVKMDGTTYIPRMCAPVIQACVEFEMVKRDRQTTIADRLLFEKEYLKELNKFMGLRYNLREIMDEYYQHISTGKKY